MTSLFTKKRWQKKPKIRYESRNRNIRKSLIFWSYFFCYKFRSPIATIMRWRLKTSQIIFSSFETTLPKNLQMVRKLCPTTASKNMKKNSRTLKLCQLLFTVNKTVFLTMSKKNLPNLQETIISRSLSNLDQVNHLRRNISFDEKNI